jgi:hypothetical protein
MTSPNRKAWVRCAKCSHVWPLVDLPCEVEVFVTVAKVAKCPRGCEAAIVMSEAPK